jgi:hypothetical protein
MEKTTDKAARKEASKNPAKKKTQNTADRKETVAQETEMLETLVEHTDWDITKPEVIPGREDHHASPKKLNKMKLDEKESGRRSDREPEHETRWEKKNRDRTELPRAHYE